MHDSLVPATAGRGRVTMMALTRHSPVPNMPWCERLWVSLLRTAAGWVALALLALFMACAPLAWCLAAMLGVSGVILFLLWPHMAIYLLAFSVPFGALWSLQLGGLTLGPSEALLAGLLGAWLIRMAAHRQVRIRRSGLAWALLAYLSTILVSFLPAHNLVAALKELFKWLSTLLVFLYVSSNAERPESVLTGGREATVPAKLRIGDPGRAPRARTPNHQTLIAALLLAGLLQGALGIYQFLFRIGPSGFVLFGRYMRASGTFGQPNPYGGYMGLLLPVAYVVVITRGRGVIAASKRGDWSPLLLWGLALISLPVMSAALIMSWSRGALLGMVGGLALVIMALGRRVWLPISLALLLLFLTGSGPLAILPSGFVGRALEVTNYLGTQDLATVEIDDDNFAVIERLAHWRAAWLMFERQPWLGVGAGQYADEYPALALPRWQDPLGHAHNYILQVMAEGGLFGLAGYLLLSVASFAALWRAARTPKCGRRDMDVAATITARARTRTLSICRSLVPMPRYAWSRTVGLAALGMWGHLMAHNLFDNLYVRSMYLVMAIMLGLVVAMSPAQQPAARTSSRQPSYLHHFEAS